MTPSRTVSVEKLLGEADWVRRLARRLVWGDDDADDVTQEVLVRALEHGRPAGEHTLRSWLAGLVQSAVHTRGRSNQRRVQRERAHAPHEATVTSTADLVEQAELQGELARHVVALPVAQREVLLLRFYEGLAPRHIAERLDVPVETVKTRLRRGLGQLRERLDEAHGSRSSWHAALAPIAGAWPTASAALPASTGTAAGTLSVLHAKPAVTIAVVALALVGIGAVLTSLAEPGPDRTTHELARLDLPPVPVKGDTAPDQLSDRDRSTRAVPVDAARGSLPSESGISERQAERELRARVIDAAGAPLAGVVVGWVDPHALHWVDETRTEIRGLNFWLRIDPPHLRDLRTDSALRAAFVRDNFPEPDRAEALLTDREPDTPQGATGLDGTLILRVTGEGEDVELIDTRWMLIGEGTDVEDGVRTLVAARARRVRGRCIDGDGRGVRSAKVRVELSMRGLRHMVHEVDWRRIRWEQSVECDGDGRFAFERVPDVDGLVLSARVGGETSAITVPPGDVAALDLVLGAEPSAWVTLHGRVTFDSGTPASGALVLCQRSSTRTDAEGRYELGPLRWGAGPLELVAAVQGRVPAHSSVTQTGVATIDVPPMVIGGAARTISGRVTRADGTPVVGCRISLAGEMYRAGVMNTERLAAVPGSTRLESDADGRFSIGGLAPRACRIRLVADGMSWSMAVAADETELTVVLPEPGPGAQVSGVVRDRHGAPISGATVRSVAPKRVLTGGLTQESHAMSGPGRSVETDDQGHFGLERVPPGGALLIEGPGLVPRTVPIEGRSMLEISVAKTGRVRVDAAAHPGAREVSFLDAKGAAADTFGWARRGLAGFPVMRVSDVATTVVLYGPDHSELARLPLTVVPGELVVVP